MKTSEILKQARALITEHGWCQHVTATMAGSHCARGAVNVIANGDASIVTEPGEWWGENPTPYPALDLLAQVVSGVKDRNRVAQWNNASGRTKQDVLDAFDAAIAIALDTEAQVSETTSADNQPVDVRGTESTGEPAHVHAR